MPKPKTFMMAKYIISTLGHASFLLRYPTNPNTLPRKKLGYMNLISGLRAVMANVMLAVTVKKKLNNSK